ncbi:hypothetical protein HA51_04615 [Pantoea rwandensis]|uniref:Aldehyde dehydrogenase domain-containing protein n=1 Tax=Pantoea rwandensis TaxID=1076550 RepID=A0A1X1D3E3_9GAMM|nr:hypothetical protein HA51_04615 [Pantoea rwandensis]
MASSTARVTSFPHMESVLGYIQKGIEEGATFLAGGKRIIEGEFSKGAYVAPTLFTNCTNDMTIVREEIFGPVMSILTYETEDEVIRRANDKEFGLVAGICTKDLARAHRTIHQLEAGICGINGWGESPAEMPVGGYKQSGVGDVVNDQKPGRVNKSERVIFIACGMSVFDISWGYELMQTARERGIGQELNLWDKPSQA